MAEAAVSLAVEHLILFLIEEAKLLKGVRGEVDFIKDEMDSIRVLLRDADARAEIDEDVKVWVKQLRQVAFRIEDVMDEFRLRVAQQPLRNEGVAGWVGKTFGCVKRLKPRHIIASDIQDIKLKLMQISERKEKYQLQRLASESNNASSSNSINGAAASWRDLNALYADEMELVGIDKPRNQLTDWLVQGAEKRHVFAVVGTGGVGKTTLVRKVFKSDQLKSHFQYHAWITVSQRFKMEDLLVELINQFYESRKESFSPPRMERTYLIDILRNYLENKRYVAILDDVWSIELWDLLKHALVDNHCGSRIMITTRENDVALSFMETSSHIFHLDPLPLEKALLLFYKTAFGTEFKGKCPQELEELSKDIVKRSGRLPLAIVAIGGLLLTKDKTVMEWKKFHDSLSSKFGKDPKLKTIMKIISLSYHDLPYYLKSCFLFFGLIPEDYPFPSHLLIPLWIAEGFVKEETGKTLEEAAEEYLDQLISRNLVQVDKSERGYILRCCVHDLMHEFILSRLNEENFCEVLDRKRNPISHEACRRLSIQNNTGLNNLKNNTNSSSLVRSVHVFGVDVLPISFVQTILFTFTQLKILDLGRTLLESLPDEISNMFHLRYLNLSRTCIKSLPSTLGRLSNLEALFVDKTYIVELPLAILKLRKLRHITAGNKNDEAVKVPKGIGNLTELQTLYDIDAEQSPSLIIDLEKLAQLRHLCVSNLRTENGRKLCAAVMKMNHLKSLTLCSIRNDEVLDLQFLSSPPPFLLSLDLRGPLEKLPDWVVSLSNLIYLVLDKSRLSHDALNMLRGLSNLQILSLQHLACVGEELHFEADNFPKLKDLKDLKISCMCGRRVALVRLDHLQSVIIEEGAMPHLKELVIQECTLLQMVPEGTTHLSNLKDLTFIDMPIDFTRRLEEDGGEDYWKVKHVPSIVIQ